MRFERVKEVKKDSKINKLIDEFIKTNYDRVEIINEEDYKNNNAMTAALRWVVKHDYVKKVKVSQIKGRVYLSKIDFEYKNGEQ